MIINIFSLSSCHTPRGRFAVALDGSLSSCDVIVGQSLGHTIAQEEIHQCVNVLIKRKHHKEALLFRKSYRSTKTKPVPGVG